MAPFIVTTYRGETRTYEADSPLDAAVQFFSDPGPCGVSGIDMNHLRGRITTCGGMEVFYMGVRVRVHPAEVEVSHV